MEQTGRTPRPGNTSTGRIHKSRCYILTIFDDEIKHFEKSVYEIWCNDTCEDGKPHKHHVIYFKNPVSFNTIKKVYPTAHIETAHSVYDAIHYIKDNKKGRKFDIEESGDEPIDTRFKSVKDLKDCANPDDLDWRQYNTYRKIHENDEIDVEDMIKEVVVYYISGPSGAGKTERAKQIIREHKEKFGSKVSIVKYESNFWHGVGSNRNIALYDDFRDSHMKPSEFINFIDYNKHYMNVKGGNCLNDYKLIIITSVQPLETIYSKVSGEPKKQWLRRITEIRIEKNEEEDDEIDIDAL